MIARLYLIALLLCIPLLCKGQDKPFNYRDFENKIKKHLYTNPDSIRIVLQQALQHKNLNDTIKGNIYNVYGIYYGTLGKPDSSIVYYKRALTLFKGFPKMQTRPLMNIASSYRNKGEFEESIKYLDQALDISKEHKLRSYEGTIYGNYASTYQYMQQYDKAVEYSLKSIAVLKQEKETGLVLSSQQKLANTYLKMKNFKFAKDIYQECIAGFKQQKDWNNYALALVNYSECLNQLEQYKAALKALEDALVLLKKLNNPQHLGVVYSKIANIAMKQKDNKRASDNYEKAFRVLSESKSIHTTVIAAEYVEFLNKIKQYDRAIDVMETVKKLTVYDNAPAADKARLDIAIAEAYSKTDDDKQAIAGLQKAMRVKDSLSGVGSNDRAREIQAQFQTEVQREKNLALVANNKLLEQDVEAGRVIVLIYLSSAIALIVLISLFLRASLLKNRLQKEQLKTVATEIDLLQHQQHHEQQLSNDQREMIEEKQRELTSTALRMASLQDSINDIIRKFDANSTAKITDIKKELVQLVKQQDYWKQFETRFNNLHPDFGTSLQARYTKLTKNDVEFCSLLKLNLSNKEIASLLQISHESAITKKYRIKKKMEINDDDEFEKLLMAI